MESTAYAPASSAEPFAAEAAQATSTLHVPPVMDAARLVAATAVGALSGASLAEFTGQQTPLLMLVGVSAGALAASRYRPLGWAGCTARVLLVVGLSALAGALFVRGSVAAAWVATMVALAHAGGRPAAGGADQAAARGSAVMAAGAVLGALGLCAALELLRARGVYWGNAGAGAQAFTGGLVGLGLFFGQRLPAAASEGRAGSARAHLVYQPSEGRRRVAQRADAYGDAPRVAQSGAASTRSGAERIGADPITEAIRSLKSSGDRVLLLLDQLAKGQPGGLVLVDEIRAGVQGTLAAAYEGVQRWGIVNPSADAARVGHLEAQIAENEAAMRAAGEGRLAEVIAATLVRQRAALVEIRGVDDRRRAFAFRLQQAEAGLDVLRVSVERAVTEGDTLKHAEVDLLIDTLNDAQAFFRDAGE